MKLVKELPFSIYHSLRLAAKRSSKLRKARGKQLPVIVSLTSIPSRIGSLHLVIRSLLTQSHLPKKIVLWLHREMQDQIPRKLLKLEGELFSIEFTDLKCSHKKLIHSLEKFPEEVIITCDDDMIYARDWLFLAYQAHLAHPGQVIGNRTLHINTDDQGDYLPYKQWKYPQTGSVNPKAVVAVGAWGILYPPAALNERVQDRDIFLELAPKSDDLWFKAMALLNNTLTVQAEILPKEPIPIIGTQRISLKKMNVDQHLNDRQWRALSDYFKLDQLIFGNGEPMEIE